MYKMKENSKYVECVDCKKNGFIHMIEVKQGIKNSEFKTIKILEEKVGNKIQNENQVEKVFKQQKLQRVGNRFF